MKTITNYLNDLKEKCGSDYATAKMLNISKEAVSQIRKRGTVADETALKMADILGIDGKEVLIAAAIARSEGEVKKMWENISKLSGIAASVTIACILSTNDANAAGLSNVQPIEHFIHYAKSLMGISTFI
ncbi:MAG: hypothetical protein WAW41_14370 [Methylobacter sp.]